MLRILENLSKYNPTLAWYNWPIIFCCQNVASDATYMYVTWYTILDFSSQHLIRSLIQLKCNNIAYCDIIARNPILYEWCDSNWKSIPSRAYQNRQSFEKSFRTINRRIYDEIRFCATEIAKKSSIFQYAHRIYTTRDDNLSHKTVHILLSVKNRLKWGTFIHNNTEKC